MRLEPQVVQVQDAVSISSNEQRLAGLTGHRPGLNERIEEGRRLQAQSDHAQRLAGIRHTEERSYHPQIDLLVGVASVKVLNRDLTGPQGIGGCLDQRGVCLAAHGAHGKERDPLAIQHLSLFIAVCCRDLLQHLRQCTSRGCVVRLRNEARRVAPLPHSAQDPRIHDVFVTPRHQLTHLQIGDGEEFLFCRKPEALLGS